MAALVGVLALTTACRDSLTAPSQDQVVAGTQQPVQNLVTGILAQDRTNGSGFNYLLYPESMARNTLRVDPNEPRFISELIASPVDPSDFIGGSGWNGEYTAIRAVNTFLTGPSFATLSAGDKAATSGFLQTVKALEYVREVQLRDSLGEAIQTLQTATPDPLKTKASVLAYTSALLDSAYSSLTAAGTSAAVPFNLPAGWKQDGDYSQTANIILFNRGLKGEVEVARALDHQSPCTPCFATAKTALTQALSGANAADLAAGPYMSYNPSAPESFANPLVDNHIYETTNFAQSIMAGDARASKITVASSPSSSVSGIKLTYRDPITDPTNLANLTRPIPIRRNAYLYLLRAQAEIGLGDLASATADINVVHTGEGNLAPYPTFTSAAAAQQAVLYEMRYSLIYEGPFYMVALRQYGGLTKAYVTQPGMPSTSSDPSHANDPLTSVIPIPANEQAARNGNITPTP